MKVCLIYPGTSWGGFGSFGKKNSPECSFINHGVASIDAYLTKFGHEVEYIDLRKLKNWSEFRRLIKKSEARIFGISSTTVDFGYAIKIAKIIKQVDRKAITVVGGVHPTIRPGEATRVKEFDIVVTGEGEVAMKDIVDTISKNKKFNNKIIKGVPCQLEEIPHIDRNKFDHENGEKINPFVNDLEVPSATIITSRGCPYNCNFCQPAERMIFGGTVRLRKISDVIKELKEIDKTYGLKSFMIHDDLFIISKDRLNEFVELYKKSGLKAKFICQARADLIIRFEKELKELKKVGLLGVMVGFESGSQRVLDYLNKNTTVEMNLKAGEICKKLKIKIWANYMLGIPSETYGEMIKTLKMIKKIDPDYYSPSLFTPYPETGLYNYCEEHKLLTFKEYEQYRRSLGGDKIKGFNYKLIRLMLFWYFPVRLKWESVSFLVKRFLR